jgi:hypothetical protein
VFVLEIGTVSYPAQNVSYALLSAEITRKPPVKRHPDPGIALENPPDEFRALFRDKQSALAGIDPDSYEDVVEHRQSPRRHG